MAARTVCGERNIIQRVLIIEESRRCDSPTQGVETGPAGFVQSWMRGFFLDGGAEHQLE
jgi:hypothetical protein